MAASPKSPTRNYTMSTPTPTTAQDEFQRFLYDHGIRYFSAREVFFRGASDERLNLNTDPPRDLWPNIIPTLKVLDTLREKMGKPIRILSCYRAPAYNRRIGGEKASYHMRFQACDIQMEDTPAARVHAVLSEMRKAGAFKGGLGRYPTFVHVDTRGYNASW
jgi:hypothetical protein